jgi:hypothetical protein
MQKRRKKGEKKPSISKKPRGLKKKSKVAAPPKNRSGAREKIEGAEKKSKVAGFLLKFQSTEARSHERLFEVALLYRRRLK